MWPVSDEEWERLNYPERFENTQYLIRGITRTGNAFRPSDWAERLCSTLAFCGTKNPPGVKTPKYSRYVVPALVDNVRCVVLDPELKNVEPHAWEFALNFARDNNLVVEENYVKARIRSLEAA
jgi:hypothetical protein